MRIPTRKTLKRKLDKLVSEIVRARGKCERCGSRIKEKLQTAHIFSRKNLAVRWDLKNMLCLCASCHWWAHLNPVLFGEFVIKYLGGEYDALKQRANTIRKWANHELEELYKQLSERR